MKYCNAPVIFNRDNESGAIQMVRSLNDATLVIDNWIDTVIFTAVRRFKADEDFGFSFWDNEFIAMNLELIIRLLQNVKEWKSVSGCLVPESKNASRAY